jgi:hypothetical protein
VAAAVTSAPARRALRYGGCGSLAAPLSVLARASVTDAVCDGSSRYTAAVTLAGAGSRLERSPIADSECNGVLVLGADGQTATCTIAGHAGADVRVADGVDVRIGACSLVGNHSPGVLNETEHLVDARGTWWGDPAGPDGDGAAGPVDHSGQLGAPVPVAS